MNSYTISQYITGNYIKHDIALVKFKLTKDIPHLTLSGELWGCLFHVQCNAIITVNFLQNSHNRHPIANPWGWGMGCLLWVWSLTIFCSCHCSVVCNIVINWTTLKRHSTVTFTTTYQRYIVPGKMVFILKSILPGMSACCMEQSWRSAGSCDRQLSCVLNSSRSSEWISSKALWWMMSDWNKIRNV